MATPPDALEACLDGVLARAAADPRVPGAMAAVHAPRIGLHWRGAVRGAADPAGDPVDAGIPFRVASVTKLFTAAAALRLVEDGVLSLHAPVRDACSPETVARLAVGGHDAGRMTLAHWMCHTSGLPDHAQAAQYAPEVRARPAHRWTREEQVALALALPAVGAPGQRFAYSDTGYVLVGELIERATGQVLGPAVRSLLAYDRLGLADTHWEVLEPDPQPGRRARQAMGDWDASELGAHFDLHGGGGIVSTVDDLCRFLRALLQGAVFRQPPTLAAALLVPPAERTADAALHSALAMTLPMGNGWGWGHLGFWGCGVVHSPELDITVAATINQPEPRQTDLRRSLLRDLAALAVAAQHGTATPA